MKPQAIHGLMVEFLTAEQVLTATQKCQQAGYREMDAYTPYPVAGLALALGLKRSRIPSVVFVGGLVGALVGFTMQRYTMAVDYPLNVGGRPYNSWPVYIPITFEVMILVASFSALLGMLFLNGLPRPHHPVFNVPGFERASQDRFFLCIEASDPQFELRETTQFLLSLSPHGKVFEVAHEETGPAQEIESAGLQGGVSESETVVQVGEQQA